ncbi:MAG: arsenic efflux protein, partial [Deltaproteobacteria bacterium]|nr:arsenic efflux protein [Deltaproteobacteria bacterium]
MIAWEVLREALLITGFVSVMMMAVEYANVFTRGTWSRVLGASRLRQYLLAAVLGAVPGCLGTFVLVALYTHDVVTLGAVVCGMMASTGDEGFVMFSLFPGTAAVLTVGQMVLGVGLGYAVDVLRRRPRPAAEDACCDGLSLHADEHQPGPLSHAAWAQLRRPGALRAVLLVVLAIYAAAVAAGKVGPEEWDWMRALILGVSGFGLFLVATASEHFLSDHLWGHVLRQHVPRIFAWTVGALAAMELLMHYLPVESLLVDNRWLVLVAALLIGIIPESGPHLIFTLLYAQGTLPASILVANTVVQDGHGLLPMLAHSRRDFMIVKAVCLSAGAAIGAAMML